MRVMLKISSNIATTYCMGHIYSYNMALKFFILDQTRAVGCWVKKREMLYVVNLFNSHNI